MVQTVDFFTPVLDDPYVFGQVAAANSISDVYAMGAEPAIALAVAAFPSKVLPLDLLGEIFRGASDKAREAGIEIAGGHSVDFDIPSYGLSVTGFCREEDLWRNGGARERDEIVLSKPVGTGVLTAAYRVERMGGAGKFLHAAKHQGARWDPADEPSLVRSMSTLNRVAAQTARRFEIHAATDVTGFGLLGHLHEMSENSSLAASIRPAAVPVLPGARRLAEADIAPSGSKRNLAAASAWLKGADGIAPADRLLLADAQTNGGLLFAVSEGQGERLAEALRAAGCLEAVMIGQFVSGKPGEVRLAR